MSVDEVSGAFGWPNEQRQSMVKRAPHANTLAARNRVIVHAKHFAHRLHVVECWRDLSIANALFKLFSLVDHAFLIGYGSA
ncbi:MAG TPA: hypothetical protein DCE31_06300 [Lautropia sp.]|nr:hypothetical protein [Lautropia sp.]